jgi:hypothetical protein
MQDDEGDDHGGHGREKELNVSRHVADDAPRLVHGYRRDADERHDREACVCQQLLAERLQSARLQQRGGGVLRERGGFIDGGRLPPAP